MRLSLFFRQAVLSGCFLLFLIGCSNSENNSNKQASSAGTSEILTSTSDTLKSKSLPILGDSSTQFKFKAEDLKAIINGQPRPTSPETLAVLAGNPPNGTDVCNLSYSALTKAMYLKCFPEGISYIAMSNVIGWAGEESSRSGDTVVYS
jgi:hypothetical protein